MDIVRSILPNGLRLVCAPMPTLRSASIAVFVGVGSRYETARTAGVSHLVEHMLFKGTRRRPRASDIAAELESVGGILNASTDKEITLYWAKVALEHVPAALDLLADMLQNSVLRPGDVARERAVIAEELRMIADDPQDWAHVLADELLWPGHPLGREIAGSHGTVERFRRRDVAAHLEEFYGANNAVVCIAGGIDPEAVVSLTRKAFETWKQVEVSSPPSAPPVGEAQWRVEDKAFEQLNACIAYPGVPREHPDRAALEVLTMILGGGASSRLFEELRERRGLVYDIAASPAHYRDTGSVIVSFATDPPRAGQALEAILGEVDRLRRRRVLDRELRKAKQFFRGRLWLALEDTNAVAGWFGSQEILQDRVTTPEEAIESVDGVGTDDVLRVARLYLGADAACVTAVGPTGALLSPLLEKGA